jgi:Ser/Thr protein kinase RdoA (MazF antagonist)
MWRLTTTRGCYAVKQLNPAIMSRPHIHDIYRLSERIAAAMADQGIPAVAALDCAGDPLQLHDDTAWLVYEWVDGEIFARQPVESGYARQIGTILGRIHALQLQFPGLELPEWEVIPDDDWDMLTYHAADMQLSWAYPVRAAMSRLIEWSHLETEAGRVLNQTLVVSHRDLDQKNVIWQDAHTPHIIDWEAAGLINPTMELVSVALYWSGQAVGETNEDAFASVMEAYIQAGGVVRDAGIDALHGYMGTWLGWLLFNMRRSIGESINSEEERQLGIHETTQTLAILRSLANNIETWAGWVDKWRIR